MNRPVGSRVTARNGSKSKTVQVKEFIKQRIIDGRSPNGSRISSERELSVQCAVSRQTVRAAIGDLVNEGFLIRVQGSGTFVHTASLAAGGNSRPDTHDVGVLVPSIQTDYYANLIHNIADRLSRHSFHMSLANYAAVPEKESECMANLDGKGCAGLIIFPSYNSFANQYYHNLKVRDLPFVLLDSHVQGVDADLVHIDNAGSAYRGTQVLIAAGCRKIAFLSGYLTAWTSRERLLGCQKALWEHGLPLGHDMIFEGAFQKVFGYNTVKRLLASPQAVDGLVIANHEITQGAIKAIHQQKLKIPDDLKICSFEQADHSLQDFFPMVVVSQPTEEMARAAVEVLLERIEEKNRGAPRAPFRSITIEASLSVPSWGYAADGVEAGISG